mgnify:FL=1|tara:strand:+ start:686 stop:1072 length:387 start_codon:yes stop_codon:yes gene_type:complete
MAYQPNQPQLNWCQYTLDGITYDIPPEDVDGNIQVIKEADALVIATRIRDFNNTSSERKLDSIKKIRLRKLKETDWYSNSDVTMPDNIKTWRQSLRDIPQNNTTEAEYDLLLARDADKNLTNSIWEAG